jgi:hypothetical protein
VSDTSFIWSPDEDNAIMFSGLFKKEKRTREENIAEDDEDEDDVEVKPKQNVIFKVGGSQSLHRLYLGPKSTQKCRDHKLLNL